MVKIKIIQHKTYKMNSNNNSNNMEEFSEEIEMDDLASINEFIKELEAREKDLHISSETVIEIEEADFDDSDSSEFFSVEPIAENPDSDETDAPDPPPADDAKISELEQEISQLKRQILKMEGERADLFELSRRRQTDFDNYKKRTERDRSETFNNQLGNLAVQILPVLDNLNRALNSAESLPDEKPKDFQQFYDGIVLVNKQLNEVMREIGVDSIASVGESFDPHFHEAVATEENTDVPANTIIEELLRGYSIGSRVIRAAMVKVSTAPNSSTSPVNSSPEAI